MHHLLPVLALSALACGGTKQAAAPEAPTGPQQEAATRDAEIMEAYRVVQAERLATICGDREHFGQVTTDPASPYAAVVAHLCDPPRHEPSCRGLDEQQCLGDPLCWSSYGPVGTDPSENYRGCFYPDDNRWAVATLHQERCSATGGTMTFSRYRQKGECRCGSGRTPHDEIGCATSEERCTHTGGAWHPMGTQPCGDRPCRPEDGTNAWAFCACPEGMTWAHQGCQEGG